MASHFAPGQDEYARLRAEFVRLMTQDSETKDRRRKDYNMAIFIAETGQSAWVPCTDMEMVLEKFDKAVRDMKRPERRQ